MRFVAGQLKGRGVMVEPPVQAGALAVAEIDAGVDVAIEELGTDGVGIALVLHGRVGHLGRACGQVLAKEAGEETGRGSSVEAVAMEQDAQFHV